MQAASDSEDDRESLGGSEIEADDAADLLLEYVQTALTLKAQGGSAANYNSLAGEISRLRGAIARKGVAVDAADAGHLAALLRALGACAASLSETHHRQLIGHALDIPLWQSPQELRSAALSFAVHLAVAQGALVGSVLQMLLFALAPPPGPPPADAPPVGEPYTIPPHDAQVQDEVLAALQQVLRLVPTAPARLLPLAVRALPHKLRNRFAHCLALRGLFSIAEGCAGGTLAGGLIDAVVEHLLSIDVEIKWQDIVEDPSDDVEEEAAASDDGGEGDIFELEGMQEQLELVGKPANGTSQAVELERGMGWEGANSANQPKASTSSEPIPVDEAADKLDSMMEQVLAFLAARCAGGGLGATWDALLGALEHRLLHTPRSKFTQYVLFFVSQQDPEACCSSLLDLLLARLADARAPAIIRTACAAYLASFLARAAFIPQALVVHTLQQLAGWCLAYCRAADVEAGAARDASTAGSGWAAYGAASTGLVSADRAGQHQVFYAACQALLYVLCYHLEPLLAGSPASAHTASARSAPAAIPQAADAAAAKQQAQQAGAPAAGATTTGGRSAEAVSALLANEVPTLLRHWLAPLSACLPSVVAEFAHQTGAFGVLDCAPLLPSAAQRRAARPLEMFFPFDPYLLKRSARLLNLRSAYVRWRRGHPQAAAMRTQQLATVAEEVDGSDTDSETASHQELPDAVDEEGDSDASSSAESASSSAASDSSDSEDEQEAPASRGFQLLGGASGRGFPRPVPIGTAAMRSGRGGRASKRKLASTPGSGSLPNGSLSSGGAGGAHLAGSSPLGISPGGASPAWGASGRWQAAAGRGVAAAAWQGLAPMSCTPDATGVDSWRALSAIGRNGVAVGSDHAPS